MLDHDGASDHANALREPTDTFDSESNFSGSLLDDVSSLYSDGKNYAEAEIRFQKTRLAFAADRGKSGLVFLLGGLALLHLALIGLVVGGIISLATLIGPLGATAVIVGVLLVGMTFLLLLARTKFTSISSAMKEKNNV